MKDIYHEGHVDHEVIQCIENNISIEISNFNTLNRNI